MDMMILTADGSQDSRSVSVRYFNLYRLIVASTFAIFGSVMRFGQNDPEIFSVAVIAYWVIAALLVFVHSVRPDMSERFLGPQVAIDIAMLALVMYASGGYRSGIPFLMMVAIAGAGLVGQGRMVLGASALATISVLLEQGLRTLVEAKGIEEFSQVAIICTGFFAVAIVARMLSRRALANEALARERGADLARQITISERVIADMQEGVIVLDRDGIVLQANPRAEKLLDRSLPSGVHLESSAAEFAARIAAEDDVASSLMLESPAGRLSVRSLRIGVSGDTVIYVEDMEQAVERARQIKLAALGRLTANIAHEIRNPLSSVSHAGELLLEEKRNDVQQRLIRIIHDNTARIERIIRDVLEVGRRDRVSAEDFELGVFCRGLLEEYLVRARVPEGVVSIDLEGEYAVRFDRVHLYRIVTNLLDNACRYASGTPGSVRILVAPEDDGRCSLSVCDDGPGIPASDHAKVFEPFFTSHANGTGLGLYMARELADANGASLELVKSIKGAEFRLGFRREG